MEPDITTSNEWRWKYRPPPFVVSPGVAAAHLLKPLIGKRKRQSLEWQEEQKRRTGFPGTDAEIGHAVLEALVRLGRSLGCAMWAAQLAAAGDFNFQGNRTISRHSHRSERSGRRYNAELMEAGLLESHLVMPGQMVPGMKAPVTRPQVVRDTRKLRALGNVRPAPHRRSSKRPSVADRIDPNASQASAEPVTAETIDECASRVDDPVLASILGTIAAAKRKSEEKPPPRPPVGAAEPMTREQIDAVEESIIRQERELYAQLGIRWKPPPNWRN